MKSAKKKTSGAATSRKASAVGSSVKKTSRIRPKLILVPIDFSPESNRALETAREYAGEFGGKIALIHVVEPVVLPDIAAASLLMENDRVMDAARKRLADVAQEFRLGKGLLDRVVVRFGRPFHEIADAASTLHADLIVLSTHGNTGLKHVLLGSVAERVVRHAPCPVLIVR